MLFLQFVMLFKQRFVCTLGSNTLLLQLHEGRPKLACLLRRQEEYHNQIKTSYQKTPNNFAKLLGALGATPSGCTKKCYHWKFIQIKTSYQKTPNNFSKLLGALGLHLAGALRSATTGSSFK